MFRKAACSVAASLIAAVVPTGRAAARLSAPQPPTEAIVCQRDETTLGFFDIERSCLPRFKGIAVRSGDVLRVVLRDGTTKAFKHTPSSCEESNDPNACVSFTLQGYHPQNDAVVVDRWLSAGPTAFHLGSYMVERAGGRVIDLPAAPHYAPDGSRFVSLSVCHDHCANRIDVWALQDGAAKLEWRRRVKQGKQTYSYRFEGWRGADQVQLRIAPEVEGQGDTGKDAVEAEAVDAMLTRVGPGWVLDSPLEP